MRGMWTRRPRVEEDSLRYLVVYIPCLGARRIKNITEYIGNEIKIRLPPDGRSSGTGSAAGADTAFSRICGKTDAIQIKKSSHLVCFVVTKYQVIRRVITRCHDEWIHHTMNEFIHRAKVRMKNKKYKHSTTARLKPVSLRLRVAMATQGWAHTSLNRRLTAYLRILWENGQYMAWRETFNICLVPHTSWWRWCCQQLSNSMMQKSRKCMFILAADFDIGLVTGLALKTGFLWRRVTLWPVCIFVMLNTILMEFFAPYRPKLYVQHFIKIIL